MNCIPLAKRRDDNRFVKFKYSKKAGFRRVSDEFIKDGIPHIKIIREADE